MNIVEIANSLTKHDLTKHSFTIFSSKENNQINYTYALKGSMPIEDKWESICTIGCDKYTKQEIINTIKKYEEEKIW